jgi:osmotically-inducible protein OsmY
MSNCRAADERADADLAGTASDSLRWNRLVPHELISVAAANGRLTLTGEVPYHYNAVRTLVGVKDVNYQSKTRRQGW